MDGKDMVCPQCDKRLKKTNWVGLKLHIDRMHPDCGLEKTFKCDECEKTLIFKCSLIKHKRQTHSKKRHVCDICGHELESNARLKEHIDAKHKSEEVAKLLCDKCDFSTVTKKYLTTHMLRKHSSKKFRKCPYCEYKTPDISRFQVHIDRYHQDVGGEKKHICDICNSAFIYERSLKYHKFHKCTKFLGNTSHPRSFVKRKS